MWWFLITLCNKWLQIFLVLIFKFFQVFNTHSELKLLIQSELKAFCRSYVTEMDFQTSSNTLLAFQWKFSLCLFENSDWIKKHNTPCFTYGYLHMQIQWHISTIFLWLLYTKVCKIIQTKSKKTVNIKFFFISKRNVWYKQQKWPKKVLFNLDFLHRTCSFLLKFDEFHQIHFLGLWLLFSTYFILGLPTKTKLFS